MALNDVWRSYREDANVYHKSTFVDVPAGPGIYAWFYPLRMRDQKLAEFIKEINTVFSFDASKNGIADGEGQVQFCWNQLDFKAKLTSNFKGISPSVDEKWQKIATNNESNESFKKMLYRASVLMPPMYVGKTIDLKRRCSQHVDSLGGENSVNSFHNRFADFAADNKLRASSVRDLLFYTIRTKCESDDEENLGDVLEDVMKTICKPPYSKI